MADEQILTRRTVLVGAGATIGMLTVGACASGGGSSTGSSSGVGGEGSTEALARVSDIPVGGAVSATGPDGASLLVAQPSAGEVVAFSAICTHLGCTVAPAGEELRCPCHGSVYDASTGEVLEGPAPTPLPSVPVHVEDGRVLFGS